MYGKYQDYVLVLEGWSPTNPRMVTHEEEVNLEFGTLTELKVALRVSEMCHERCMEGALQGLSQDFGFPIFGALPI